MHRCCTVRAFQWVTVVLLALVCGSWGFVVPTPRCSQAAASRCRSAALLPDVTHDVRMRPRLFDGASTTTLVRVVEEGMSRPPGKTTDIVLAASRGGGQGGEDAEDKVEEKSTGIEPK